MRVLVAGFGNTLRGDDGFGVEVLRRLESHAELPPIASVLEVGIGGISLVQELLAGYDGLIVLDALEGEEAGSVKVLELEVKELVDLSVKDRRDYFADVHFAEPGRALALAKAVGSLPKAAYLIGCVPRSCELGQGLSTEVSNALASATRSTLELLETMARDLTAVADDPDGPRRP